MSVVQRCPNCGTTQAGAGECEACHEAKVRYFCTNHEPGIWLAGPTCPVCEARAVAPAPMPAPRPRARPPTIEPAPRARVAIEPEPALVVRASLWKQLLGAMLARRATLPVSAGRGWLAQLVRRLALVAVILVVALVGVVYWLAHSLR